MVKELKAKADYVFEVSWEVCNKVGGIFTVIKSKAFQMKTYYENYFLIGPYFADKAAGQFIEEVWPKKWEPIFQQLQNEGITMHYGKWLIEGEPQVILIDSTQFKSRTNEVKKELWEKYQVDSLRGGDDFNEPFFWAQQVGRFLEGVSQQLKGKKIVGHFHEWLAGAALLYLKSRRIKIATTFTTHATVMGRALASNNVDLYSKIDNGENKGKYNLELIDKDKTAKDYGIEPKHTLEKAAAQQADIFTTVSEITALEAKYVLGREPEVLVFNGLDINKFPTFEEISIKHDMLKAKIKEFLIAYFFPYYKFNLDEVLIFFLAGRYEFKDKGIDVYIKALEKLNEFLKKEKIDKTVVAFIWVPTATRGIKPELLQNLTLFKDVYDSYEEEKDMINQRILYSLASGTRISEETIFTKDFIMEMKRKLMRMKKEGKPYLATHEILNTNDIIMKTLLDSGLDNMEDDKVKTIFYPIYLTGADGLLDLDYDECIIGSHLGVFPSYYEPWGYTPLETAALGVSSVTTDLAGFGLHLMSKQKGKIKKTPGIFVLQRKAKNDEKIAEDLAEFMRQFVHFSKHERVENKIEARKRAEEADWKEFIKNYIRAHNQALKKLGR